METTKQSNRQVSVLSKVAYGSGHGLVSVKNMLFHFFYLFYFSNVLGVSEILVLIATTIAIIIDAISDPIMGQISDNFRSKKWGRRHGFMVLGMLPTAIGLALLFSPPAGLGQTGLFIWMVGFTIFVRLGLTVYGVPYYSLGAELSTDYNERTSIVGYREFFNTVFNIAIILIGLIIFLPDTPQYPKGMMNEGGYGPFVTTMAIIALVTAMIATFGTKKAALRINTYQNNVRASWTQTFKELSSALHIRPFALLCAGYSLMIILYGTGSALSFYIGDYLWQISDIGKALVTVGPLITLIPAVILASVLSAKFDKKQAATGLGSIYVFCAVFPYSLYLLGLLPPVGSDALLYLICIFNAVAFMGLTGTIVVSYSMLADIADVLELQTSKRQEGVLSAAFTFAQKMTFAVGTAIASISLIAISFPRQKAASEVDPSAIQGLAIVSIITALLFGLTSLACFMKYSLTRAELSKVQMQLNI